MVASPSVGRKTASKGVYDGVDPLYVPLAWLI
jgi:hypothetical protein